MLRFEDFVNEYAGEVENDDTNIWINDGLKTIASITIDKVMKDKAETEPFQASRMLDEDKGHPAWNDLYANYLERTKNGA